MATRSLVADVSRGTRRCCQHAERRPTAHHARRTISPLRRAAVLALEPFLGGAVHDARQAHARAPRSLERANADLDTPGSGVCVRRLGGVHARPRAQAGGREPAAAVRTVRRRSPVFLHVYNRKQLGRRTPHSPVAAATTRARASLGRDGLRRGATRTRMRTGVSTAIERVDSPTPARPSLNQTRRAFHVKRDHSRRW